MKREIALFDFDGTITSRDTLLEFIKFSKGTWRFLLGFVLNSPWIIAYKVKLIPNQRAKEKVLSWFFRNVSTTTFQDLCDRFHREALPALIRPKALTELSRLRTAGVTIAIVSASPENWIRQWALENDATLIATKLAIHDNRLTGRIDGRNCYGPEKAIRVQNTFPLNEFDTIYAYGDSSGDKELLAIAHFSFFRPFQ